MNILSTKAMEYIKCKTKSSIAYLMALKPSSLIGITFMLIVLLVPQSIEPSQSSISQESMKVRAMSGQSPVYTNTSKSLEQMRLPMPKLPKCAYIKGDLVNHSGQMGIVTESDGEFYTFQLLGSNPITHTTMNVTIKHYLKLVKAQHQITTGRGHSSEFVVRNLTLEEVLIDTDPQPLITGETTRLSEATLNKIEEGEGQQ